MAALTPFIHGGGPIIPGSVYPFVMITIACGALSGFHAIIGSGTTPKMGYPMSGMCCLSAMARCLLKGLVAIMALIAACVLVPADYFAINSAPAVYQKLGMVPVNLPDLAAQVQENIQGRPGGAVSLAVGIGIYLSSVPL